MSRLSGVLLLVVVMALSALGCGSSPSQKLDSRELARQQAVSGTDALNLEIGQIRTSMQKVREQQYELSRSLDDLQKKLDNLPQSSEAVKRALEQMKAQEGSGILGGEGHGWPWPIKLLLVLAIVVIAYILYKKVAQDDEEDSEEGIIEETNLGSIRYPSDQPASPAVPEPKDEGK
ncbi:TPA: hypothetical protein DDW35_08975 [Candidatus Sumerlaeota bacterium]|nr:hypothetical protein [Candidatus Sumerlaeota bacterium]